MIKRYLRFLILFTVAFSFTSCIDLVEEISINHDLSGHYELRLETGGLGSMMGQMGNQISIPQLNELESRLRVLRAQAGISNVQKHIKIKELRFHISFDFENEKALNNAIYQLAGIEPNIFLKKFLKVKKHKLVRPNLNPYIQRIIEDRDLLNQLPSTDLLSYVDYKFILNSPYDIKSVSNSKAIIQSDKKTMISSYSLKELVLDKKNIYLKVKY